jgi:hypothetical protein
MLKSAGFENHYAKIHGIVLDSNTPLSWLAHSACYADSFLHFTLIPKLSDPV